MKVDYSKYSKKVESIEFEGVTYEVTLPNVQTTLAIAGDALKLQKLIEAGEFDGVLVYSLSRLLLGNTTANGIDLGNEDNYNQMFVGKIELLMALIGKVIEVIFPK